MTGNPSFDFGGQTAIVTGAAWGMGREVGPFLQQAKADVSLLDSEGEEVEKAAAVIGAHAGIIAFTKAAAKKLARFGVTANAISPNAETRMMASIPYEKRAKLAAAIPRVRFAEASEMCTAVAFLASREGRYVTGVVLPVDGGISM